MTLKQLRDNPLMLTDAYNISHSFIKKSLKHDQSHLYNREQPMVLYGLNEIIRSITSQPITEENVIEAAEMATEMGMNPFPEKMFMEIVKEFGGYLPLKIKALLDGTWVPKGCPFLKIENTVDGFGELPTYYEGVLMHAYFPSACATRAAYMRQYLIKNQCNMWRFHSFGFRGHTSLESAYWAGTAWNLFLTGTDDFHTKKHTPKAQISSIYASAHKVEQQFDNELEGYIFAIGQASKNGKTMVALPIDTYNANTFIEKYLEIVCNYGKQVGVHVVLRPDSGNTLDQAIAIHNKSRNLDIKNVSVIIGESVTFDRIKEDDQKLIKHGVPLNFVNWGIGAGFYKDLDRDWLGWAMKTSISNGKDRMKFSMDRIKQSIPGDVCLLPARTEQGNMTTNMIVIPSPQTEDLYETIYEYGECDIHYTRVQTWDEIYEKCKTIDPHPLSGILLSYDLQDKMEAIRKQYLE